MSILSGEFEEFLWFVFFVLVDLVVDYLVKR